MLVKADLNDVSQAVTPMSTWYSNIQKASYVHTEVIPADLMQATHIASEILRTPSSMIVSVLSCGTGSGCSAAVNIGYRCGKNCHRPFLPHVLVIPKLLKSLPQLTEGAVNICCACWTHPDSGQLPIIATPAYQKTAQTHFVRRLTHNWPAAQLGQHATSC